jgi:8-oxo-dGTP diphosphatase
MTAYYAAVARRFGGRVTARYKNAICLIMAEGEVFEHSGDELSGNAFYIVSEPHSKQRVEGFPIDPLSKHIKSGAYYYDLDDKAVSDDDTYGMSEGFRAFFKRALQQPH